MVCVTQNHKNPSVHFISSFARLFTSLPKTAQRRIALIFFYIQLLFIEVYILLFFENLSLIPPLKMLVPWWKSGIVSIQCATHLWFFFFSPCTLPLLKRSFFLLSFLFIDLKNYLYSHFYCPTVYFCLDQHIWRKLGIISVFFSCVSQLVYLRSDIVMF